MEEIFQLCDRITILRDGQYVGTENIKDITMDGVVQMMIGREIGERYPQRDAKIGEEVAGFVTCGACRDENATDTGLRDSSFRIP